ncbi:MAG: AAA family ATPase [Clostridiales bacterium]|nr:AAA family ATPase [Clostridiales bacterium]
MDYKKAIRQIIERRQTALDRAESTYLELIKSDQELLLLEKKKRSCAIKGDDKEYAEYEEIIKRKVSDLGLADIIYPTYACALCKDTAFVGNKLCSCVKKLAIKSEDIAFELRSFADSKPELFGENAQFYLATQNNLQALCEKFPNNKKKNVMLLGKPGTGKTFLASCIANTIMQRGFSVMFLTAFEAVERMLKYHTTFDATKFSYLAPMLDCDVLIIDDLGSESMFKNVTVEYFFHVINERRLANKTTVITSNLTVDEIGIRYGERTASRLFDKSACYTAEFNFADSRKININ